MFFCERKTVMHPAHAIHAAHEAAEFAVKFAWPDIDLNKLRAKGDNIVDRMTSSLLKVC